MSFHDVTDGDKRRKRIFDIYSHNLHNLVNEGILDVRLKFLATLICPICVGHFSEDDLNQNLPNPLTLEDAPPKSLGGKANVLTCKTCNNKCGANVDYHLSQQMTELDKREMRPGIEFDAHFEKDGEVIQGRVIVGSDGTGTVIHYTKNNNPKKLTERVATIKSGDGVQILFKQTKVEAHKIQLALLKTAYLMTFEKYGYAFILDPIYDRIRKQLSNPDELIYPLEFWFNAPFPKEALGVPFVIEPGLESVMPTFILKTPFSERMFSAIVPITTVPIEEIVAELKSRFQSEGTFEVRMDAMTGANYLEDIEATNKMLEWIKQRRA